MRVSPWIVLLAGLLLPRPSVAAGGLDLVVTRSLDLPARLTAAQDVRWDGAQALLLAVGGLGVVRVPYSDGTLGEPMVLVPERKPGGVAVAARLASSTEMLAVAAPASDLRWIRRDGSGEGGALGTWHQGPVGGISFFESIDLRGSLLAILGVERGERSMSPDGAIAWVADLAEGSLQLRPIAYSKAGPGARPFDACALFGIGAVRFLADGRLLLVPGAEPGIYLYAQTGKLLRTWDTSRLGVDVSCNLPDEQVLRMGGDERERLRYLAGFSRVDSAFDTPRGPGVIVSRPSGTGRSWVLFLLGDGDEVREIALPWRSPERGAELSVDALGERLIFLESVHVGGAPPERARLHEARLVAAGQGEGKAAP